MKKPQNEKTAKSLINLNKAFSRLETFLQNPKNPIVDDRDKAGVIQAFEFTFELFWKTFKKVAEEDGFSVSSPKQSLKAAFQLDFILLDEESDWISMLEDRNLSSHTYQEDLANEIFDRIRGRYFKNFQVTRGFPKFCG